MATLNSMEEYGASFQMKVISSLLTHKEFLQNINDTLSEEYFTNPAHQWIINEIVKYYEKFHTTITVDILKVEIKKIPNEILRISIKEQLKLAYLASEEDLKYVQEEFSLFCKNQQLKRALLTSVDFLRDGDYDSIRNVVDKALRSGQNRNIGHEYEKDIEARYRENQRCPIKFPWNTFNKITQGGYGKGDLVLIFGNPKGGKSWALVAMAAEAALAGINVIYYSLELGSEYVGKRFDAYFTGIPVDQIDDHKDTVNQIVSQIPGRIIIKDYPPKRATLTTLKSHFEQVENQEQIKIGAVYIDYLDLLKNKNKGRTERKDDTDDIFTDAKGFAKEKDIPVVSPSQANRTGAEKEILEGTHIGGSYEKLMIADLVFSLARGRADRIAGTGRWHVMGNRYGKDGVTYSSLIDTSMGHIKIDEEELDDNTIVESQLKAKNNGGFNDNEKETLRNKFFELDIS